MLAQFKNWLRFKDLRLRRADLTDINFVLDEIITGAKEGHFHMSFLEPVWQQNFRNGLEIIIAKNQMIRINSESDEVEILNASLWMYGSKKLDNVGFFLLTDWTPGFTNSEVELNIVGIKKEFRGKGYGKDLIKRVIKYSRPEDKIFVRCFKASDVMVKCLMSCGFSLVNTTERGTRLLVLDNKVKT